MNEDKIRIKVEFEFDSDNLIDPTDKEQIWWVENVVLNECSIHSHEIGDFLNAEPLKPISQKITINKRP